MLLTHTLYHKKTGWNSMLYAHCNAKSEDDNTKCCGREEWVG